MHRHANDFSHFRLESRVDLRPLHASVRLNDEMELVVVFIAAPLGIGFSRRGVLSSVAASIILVFSMNFLTHLFLALGEGARIPSWTAAWTPNLIFAVIGMCLLYLRATNRDGLGFNLGRARRILAR